MAQGMLEKKASKLFITQAKLTIEKHFHDHEKQA